MRTPVEERELVISGYTYNQDGSKAGSIEVYTSDYTLMSKFDRLSAENPESWRIKEVMKCGGDIVGKRYECKRECVTFRARPVQGRAQTEEQKQAARERMNRMHEAGIL